MRFLSSTALAATAFAAPTLLAALAPVAAQQAPSPTSPMGTFGGDDPESGSQPSSQPAASLPYLTEADDGEPDTPSYAETVAAERLEQRPELPEDTPANIVEHAMQGAPVTSLSEALRLAYWTSPPLLAQRATVRSTDYRLTQARAGYGPRLNYNLGTTWQRDRFEQRTGPSLVLSGWTTTASAVLTQPLFTFGRNASQERGAVAQIDFQKQVLRSTEQQALLDAIAAYIGVLRDRAAVVIAKDNLAALERQLSDNQARLDVHEVTATDVLQITTRVSLGRAQVYNAQRDAASSEAAFLRMVGVPAGDLAAPNPLRLPVRQLEEAYAYAELHSPIVLAAQAREKVSRATVAQAKADLMPRIDLQGSASINSQSAYNDNLRTYDTRAQFIISGPIFESGLRRARIGEAMAANDADWRLLDASLRENRAVLASAWNDWQAQQAAIASFREAETAARRAYEGAVLQQRAGLITTLDVLDLARELLVARSNSNFAMANAYLAKARVLAAAGALEQAWLLPDEPRHNADRHSRAVKRDGDIPVFTPIMRALDTPAAIGGTDTRAVRDPAGDRTAAPIVIQPAETLAGPSIYNPPPIQAPAPAPNPTPSPAPAPK